MLRYAPNISRLDFMAWDCNSYFSYLFDRTPHWDTDILQDWYPTDDAWIGQVMTTPWDPFTGTEHVYDRLHFAAPDLTAGWNLFDTQSMLTNNGLGEAVQGEGCTTACSREETCVAWGDTRKTYGRYTKSFATRPFCFDEINTRARAKEQLASIVKGLKDVTKQVQSDFLRTAAMFFADKIYIAGQDMLEVDITPSTFSNNALTTIDITSGELPTSELTIQYLQRFYEPLEAEGYFRNKYVVDGMFKLITDPITSQQLTAGNPTLQSLYRFTDFQKGGELFKYGIKRAIGNFGIAWDSWPARFYWDEGAGVLRRVWPFVNISAGDPGGPTMGIKKVPNTQWIRAPYQISYIWHPEAMRRLTPHLESVNPEMPFLTRDLAGKWNFIGGNRDRMFQLTDPSTGDTCVIDNKRGNQGAFFADFEAGIKFERPELIRGILHLREPGCVTDKVPCSTPPSYVLQPYTCLPLCQEVE